MNTQSLFIVIIAQICVFISGHTSIAQSISPQSLAIADIHLVGEVHDNATHHAFQAAYAKALAPKAIVFEMIREDRSDLVNAMREAGTTAMALSEALDWDNSGWPDFQMYFSIMAAAPEARIYGAGQKRTKVRQAFSNGAAQEFGAYSSDYGLDAPLEAGEAKARQKLQFEAHCSAMPENMMSAMVEAQRFRDASFARVTIKALAEVGPPVLVIAGNGHIRKDWGIPRFLQRIRPDTTYHAIGQSEVSDSSVHQDFSMQYDQNIPTPVIERDDPCKAFQK